MKKTRISVLIATALITAPLAAIAQNAPQAVVAAASVPGKAAVGEAVQIQGKVKSISKANRSVIVSGPQGKAVLFNLGDDVRNIEQIRVGDLVTLTYAQALALELHKVANNGIRERVESEQSVRTPLGDKPAGAIQKTVRIVANVVAINPKAQTVTLRGAKRTVELAVNDPAMLKEIQVGNQVEATYVEAVVLEVTAGGSK